MNLDEAYSENVKNMFEKFKTKNQPTMQKMTDEQRMSETKLPKEVIEQIEAIDVPAMAYRKAMDLVMSNELPLLQRDHFRNGYYEGMKLGQQQGAAIAADHYAAENKRVVDLLREQWCANKSYELAGFDELNEDWQQYCKDNGINQNA